ncbi:hypothetical protein HPB49_010982 [Dermacentor silvarum]|uniref:Uncharacterized protein n=1 Tax=Dermacentor silvarum TaxID=543639 RepID=A0ACB8CKG4_DERSI|nr:hypothetical protein HPB49_010982 [Dermacentor silvarum]
MAAGLLLNSHGRRSPLHSPHRVSHCSICRVPKVFRPSHHRGHVHCSLSDPTVGNMPRCPVLQSLSTVEAATFHVCWLRPPLLSEALPHHTSTITSRHIWRILKTSSTTSWTTRDSSSPYAEGRANNVGRAVRAAIIIMVNELTYAEAVTILEEFYAPRPNKISASFNFFTRIQREEESSQQFIMELRRLTDKCNFGKMFNRLLRDRIVSEFAQVTRRRHCFPTRNWPCRSAENTCLQQRAAGQVLGSAYEADGTEGRAELHRLAVIDASDSGKTCSQARDPLKAVAVCGIREHGEATCAFKHAKMLQL